MTREDLSDVTGARADALIEWDRRIASIISVAADDSEQFGARRERMEARLLQAFAARINAEQQQDLGIDQYVWRSRDDSDVRPLHATHDDKVFDWDDPPEGGHPGHAFNCRCHAEPYLPDDEPDWVPDIGPEFEAALRAAEDRGFYRAVRDFAADYLESLRDLIGLAGTIGELAYLLLKLGTQGLTRQETQRFQEILGGALGEAEALKELALHAPKLAVSFRNYSQSVHARARETEAAYRSGFTTQADAEAAREASGYLNTQVLLHTISSVGLGATTLPKLLKGMPSGKSLRVGASVAELRMHLQRLSRQNRNWLRRDFRHARNTAIIFGKGIRQQGDPFEAHLAKEGKLGLWLHTIAPNFKTFDFWDKVSKTATSVKTIDVWKKSYTDDPRRIFHRLKGYIDKMHHFGRDMRNDFELSADEIVVKRLELAIPRGVSSGQLNEIRRAIAYAESLKIEMIVTVVHQ
ncbi:phage minor head protein [Notoacmeibacter ruber]|uniref:endonuclease toxin domain-containing protein n=1 Tax=Notoacmeibacter ruber TaxID=2670375 RepID=UPI0013140DD3|nr:phage minor head protein [Notoacmeibacter ruber]